MSNGVTQLNTVKVVAFDPGQTTGVAVYFGGTLLLPVTNAQSQFATLNLDSTHIASLVQCWGDYCTDAGIIIVESFQLFPHKAKDQIGSTFPSVDVIGQIRMLAHLTEKTQCLVFQQPNCQTAISETMLRKYGVWQDRSNHERSALKHLIYHLRVLQNRRR